MELREFTTTDRWWLDCWGGGHTPGTDPVSQGWRVYPIKGTDRKVVVIGRKGQDGCASIVRIDGRLNVALYDEAPELVAVAYENSLVGELRAQYIEIDNYPGWGLAVIEAINPPWGCVVLVEDADDPKPYTVALTVRAATGVQAGEIAEQITGGSLFFFCPASDTVQRL